MRDRLIVPAWDDFASLEGLFVSLSMMDCVIAWRWSSVSPRLLQVLNGLPSGGSTFDALLDVAKGEGDHVRRNEREIRSMLHEAGLGGGDSLANPLQELLGITDLHLVVAAEAKVVAEAIGGIVSEVVEEDLPSWRGSAVVWTPSI